jgi:hypothetical protein
MRHSPEAIGTFWDIGKGVTVASAVTAWTAYSSLTHRITTHSPEAIGTFWDIGKGVAAALRSYVVAAAFTAVATFAASSSLADHIKNAGHAGDTERRLRDALPLTLPKPSAAPALGASSRQRGAPLVAAPHRLCMRSGGPLCEVLTMCDASQVALRTPSL